AASGDKMPAEAAEGIAARRLERQRQPVEQPESGQQQACAQSSPLAGAGRQVVRAGCAQGEVSVRRQVGVAPAPYPRGTRRARATYNRLVAELLNYLRGDGKDIPLKRSPQLQSPGRQRISR